MHLIQRFSGELGILTGVAESIKGKMEPATCSDPSEAPITIPKMLYHVTTASCILIYAVTANFRSMCINCSLTSNKEIAARIQKILLKF